MSTLTERFYRLLLRLYPLAHRHEYGEWMVQHFRDSYRDVSKNASWRAWLGFWLHLLGDVAVSAFVEHRVMMKENGIMLSRNKFMRFLPMMGLIVYLQFFHYDIGIGAVYAIILLAGLVGWGLSRLGMFSFSPLWRAYTLGAVLGFFSLLMLVLGGGITVWTHQFPAIFVAELTVVLYIAGVFVLSHWLKPSNKVFYGAAIGLPLLSIVLLNLSTIPSEIVGTWSGISIPFVLTHAFTSLFICAICLHSMRNHGQLGVIMLSVALGTQYIFIDPAYFTGTASFGIDFVVLLFPLVICPIWWLSAKTLQAQRMGTFALWGGFIAFTAIIPTVLRLILGLYIDGQILLALSRLTMVLPHLIAMWVILQAAPNHPHPKWSAGLPVFTASDAAMR